MKIEQRYRAIIEWFSENMPEPETELNYQNPFQLLVSVILSAQATDKRVNIITPALFDKFPTPERMAEAEVEEVYEQIRSINYPNSKSKYLVGTAKMLVEQFDGKVPDSITELQKLPGVGRKTANVVGAVLFGREVMPVDTHVFRVSARIGLTWGAKNPVQTEEQLSRHFPSKLLPKAHHWLILHGRYVCTARAPKCEECGIAEYCRYRARELRKGSK